MVNNPLINPLMDLLQRGVSGALNRPIDPTAISGLSLWLDASDDSTITQSGGGGVSQWNDKSGNGYNATSSGTNRPTIGTTTINGRNVITFDGSTDYMDLGNAGNWANGDHTYYVVFRQDVVGEQHILTGHVGGSGTSVLKTTDFGGQKIIYGSGTNVEQDFTFEDNIVIVGGTRDTVNDMILSINGFDYTDAGVTGSDQNITNGYKIGREDAAGGRRYFNGDILEIFAFDGALTQSDRRLLEGYLAWKWGIPQSLTAGHPYKSNGSIFGYGFWTPALMTSSAWYDAADASTITASGGNVSQWADKSGNDYHATQGTGANQPATGANTQNGKNVLTFDGTEWFFLDSGLYGIPSGDNTVFAVSLSDNSVANSRIINFHTGGTVNTLRYITTPGTIQYFDGATASSTGNTDTQLNILSGRTEGSTVGVSVNGEATITTTGATSNTATGGNIGCFFDGLSDRLAGQVAEVLIFNTALNLNERQILEGFLAHKWGTTASLDSSNPYKNDGVFFGFNTVWSPEKLSNLELWLDASDASTITHSSGSVSQLDDKSGNGNHATQGTGANQPLTGSETLNGLNVLTFDGVDDLLNIPTLGVSNDAFIAIVYKPDNDTEYSVVAGSSNHWDRFTDNENYSDIWRDVRLNGVANGAIPSNDTAILSYNADSTNSLYDVYLDGDNVYSMSGSFTFTDNLRTVGGNSSSLQSLDGIVAEVIVVNEFLSTDDRQVLEGYLAHKWGLTASLPSGHPYKTDGSLFGF